VITVAAAHFAPTWKAGVASLNTTELARGKDTTPRGHLVNAFLSLGRLRTQT